MDPQLHDQWNALLEAESTGDRLLQTRLTVEMAKVLLEDATCLNKLPADPDRATLRLLSQWALCGKVLADYLSPVTVDLDNKLSAFKSETLSQNQRVTQATTHLETLRVEYEETRQKYEALLKREPELRAQVAALETLRQHHKILTELDATITPGLTELSCNQSALTKLWAALAEACRELQAQRELLRSRFASDLTIVDALRNEVGLLGQVPSEHSAAAIIRVAELRKALDQLEHELGRARQTEQQQINTNKVERL